MRAVAGLHRNEPALHTLQLAPPRCLRLPCAHAPPMRSRLAARAAPLQLALPMRLTVPCADGEPVPHTEQPARPMRRPASLRRTSCILRAFMRLFAASGPSTDGQARAHAAELQCMGYDVRDEILPFCQMSRYLGKAQDRDELLLADRLPHLPALNDDELRHAAAVDDAEVEREEEARLGVEKATSRQTRPNGVAENDETTTDHLTNLNAVPLRHNCRQTPCRVRQSCRNQKNKIRSSSQGHLRDEAQGLMERLHADFGHARYPLHDLDASCHERTGELGGDRKSCPVDIWPLRWVAGTVHPLDPR